MNTIHKKYVWNKINKNKNEAMKLKDSKEGYMKWLQGRKGKQEIM